MKVLKMLRPLAYGANIFLFINFIIGIIVMGLNFIQPLFYALFIDEVILNTRFSLMPIVAAGYFFVFALNCIFSYVKRCCTNRWVNRVTFRAKMKILNGFFKQEFSEYDNQSIGDMKMRLEDDTDCIADYASMQTIDYATACITLIISAVLLFVIEWRLAVFACIGIPLTFWLDRIISKRESALNEEHRENQQSMSSWIHASVQGWREIKALNLQKHEERQFIKHIRNFAVYNGQWINYWVLRVMIIPKIKEEFLMRFALYFFGGLLIIRNNLGIGALLVFMQYYAILSGALETVSNADAKLLSEKPKSERLLSELNKNTKKTTQMLLSKKSFEIKFSNVSFSYPTSENAVIERLNLTISKGERVAITGKSGAGKTTILKLMLGMLYPTHGEVLLSGVPVRNISPESLHKHFGFVMQESILFNTSIKKNLLYAKPTATENELTDACEKAFIFDFIKNLPDGINTIIGERGIKLSGGQKQRIIIARQFLRDASIIVFDEATSALDQHSENIIQEAIETISKNKTIIIVAHRKSSIALCDRVIEL